MATDRKVVDTSAWIEWARGGAIGTAVGLQLPEKLEWLVPTVVQLELWKWLLREADEAISDRLIGFTRKCVVVPMDTTIARLAAEVHRDHKLATADAIIYATARFHEAEVLTCDAHFKDLPDVVYVAKGARLIA